MDILKAEIERKRKLIEEKNVLQKEKRFFKRGDLAAVQEAEYLAKYGPKKEDLEELRKEADNKSSDTDNPETALADIPYFPREEVIRKLRERLQPITLFGESEKEANFRCHSLEISEGDNARLQQSTNNFQEALKNVDAQYLKAIQKHKESEEEDDGPGDKKHRLELKVYSTNLSYQDLLNMANDLRKGNHKHDENVIAEWIKVLTTMWGHELNSRHESEKMTVKGKMEAATYTQTKGYIKPLLKLLRRNQLNDDIRDSLSFMLRYVMQRDYILANEKYMEMAIGNAPWPIGVTNAGIHARPGRERIYSKNVGHVLNDEKQRRYIQGLKRLMTKCQQYFPTDPSRSMDFSRPDYGTEIDLESKAAEPPAKTFVVPE